MYDCIQAIETISKTSIRFGLKSDQFIQVILELTENYKKGSASEREKVLLHCSSLDIWKRLLGISALISEKAMHTNNVKWIETALILHIIEDFRWDYRENIRYLVLTLYAANYIGVNFKKKLKELIPLGSEKTQKYLMDFLKRDKFINEISKFGLKISIYNGVPKFTPC